MIGGFTQGSSAGVFDLSVSISGITVGDNATAANLEKVFGVEGAGELDEGEFKEANVDVVSERLEADHGLVVDKRKIQLPTAIRAYGRYDLDVKLYTDVTAKVHVLVCN